ncbi:MAG: hypoxanthine phosphoribosyltransferase [Anaerolineae bacterium]
MTDYPEVEQHLKKVLIPEGRLQARIRELGAQISQDYLGQDLLLVCVLKGGVMFLTDLMRHITVPHEIDFMAVSSYDEGVRESSGVVRIMKDLDKPLENRNVLLVEDIIDSGHTLHYLLQLLEPRNPASLRICTLLNKAERRQVNIPLHYIGFDIPNEFVFGYGLDLDEKFRNLPFIGVVDI